MTRLGFVCAVAATLLACGDHEGIFKGAFTASPTTAADLSAFEAEEVDINQYKLARCTGGFLSSSSDCKLTYWENKASSKISGIKQRQVVFRMSGYPENGLQFPVGSTDGGVSISVEYLEFPDRELSENERVPSWDATSGSVTTDAVTDKGFKFRVEDVTFKDGFKLNGSGEVYAPPPPADPTK